MDLCPSSYSKVRAKCSLIPTTALASVVPRDMVSWRVAKLLRKRALTRRSASAIVDVWRLGSAPNGPTYVIEKAVFPYRADGAMLHAAFKLQRP